ncbi:MAG: DUF2497 domain-containing protein [Erythrobacter sp.]|jgi:cell pole-organizing protein PopZ|nr:DUF2497 domain-containing protein [Erythrobacter sp.]
MAKQNEASVEEILESIKKVIARDNRVEALAVREARPVHPGPASDPADADVEDEVLDLSEMLDAEDFADDSEAREDRSDDDADAPLVAEEVRGAMQENLAALAMLAEPGARPQIVRSGETSLEGLTRELLRPMLAEWLEKNLPGMVEKLVQAEIARIAGKRR